MTQRAVGASEVTTLLEQRRLQRVPIDDGAVEALVAASEKHVSTAAMAAATDPDGAYSLAYDAVRKSASALLARQGLRATSRGGHISVVRAVTAQFPGEAGLASMDRLRRRRNQVEYPDPETYDPIDVDELEDAISVAGECVAAVRRILADVPLGEF